MTNPDAEADAPRQVRQVRIGLALLAVPTLLTGAWATFAPRSWYSDYGESLEAVPSAFGAYNEHFVQDLGSGFLAVAAILLFALLWPRRDAVRIALLGFAVQTVPHFVIHLIDEAALTRRGYLSINFSLAFGLVVALWVLWLNERGGAKPASDRLP